MAYKSLTQQLLKELNSTDRIRNTISAILEKAKIEIIKFVKELGRGKCPWVHYQLSDGRRLATFISPKSFQGYKWIDEYSKVVNLENGETYQVSDTHCTCKSWEYQVKTGKRKTCKHQRMRQLEILRRKFPVVNLSDSLPSIPQTTSPVSLQVTQSIQAKTYKIDPTILKKGLSIVPSQQSEGQYDLKAWHKNTPLSIPALKRIGQIVLAANGFIAR
ncbi:MAG: SWIM zinc finger family protein, partial [Prochloraceae cyanobacterium]